MDDEIDLLNLHEIRITLVDMMEQYETTSQPLNGVAALRHALASMTQDPGVYRMLNAKGEIIYIGKAKQLKNRVSNYVNIAQLTLRMQRMVMMVARVETTVTANEAEALLLEANLIKKHQPRYNILLKDDKMFPYIRLSMSHAYPRIDMYRGAKIQADDYFGPFVSASAVHEVIALLQKAFLLRPCSDTVFKNRSRPCLQHQIKRCSAPCVGLISGTDYAELVKQARDFLRGKSNDIQLQLTREMETASATMQFEKAAQLRDRIRALSYVQQQQIKLNAEMGDADAIIMAREGEEVCVQVHGWRGGRYYGNRAFFPSNAGDVSDGEILSLFLARLYQREAPPAEIIISHALADAEVLENALRLHSGTRVTVATPKRGDRLKLVHELSAMARTQLLRKRSEQANDSTALQKLVELFGLEAPPARIEVYDNSHIMGTNQVGAMIVAGPDGFQKNAYRQFNIRSETLTPGDDYAMLREVLTRRFKRLMEETGEVGEGGTKAQWPDLVLIDGGAGQLSSAEKVFADLGVSDVVLAAIAKGPDRNAGREWFYMPGREPFQLPPSHPALHYLQRLRDEAHRFAIGTHRNRRSKALISSSLDEIPSIGAVRKKALLLYFGSARALRDASVEEIARVPGFSRELAQKVYDFYR